MTKLLQLYRLKNKRKARGNSEVIFLISHPEHVTTPY